MLRFDPDMLPQKPTDSQKWPQRSQMVLTKTVVRRVLRINFSFFPPPNQFKNLPVIEESPCAVFFFLQTQDEVVTLGRPGHEMIAALGTEARRSGSDWDRRMGRSAGGFWKGEFSTALLYGSLALFTSILHNVFLLYYVETFVSVYKIDKVSFWVGEVSERESGVHSPGVDQWEIWLVLICQPGGGVSVCVSAANDAASACSHKSGQYTLYINMSYLLRYVQLVPRTSV